MDIGRYVDFHEDDEYNTIWNFIPTEKGFKFEKYTLTYARLGDSDSVYCSFPASVTNERGTDDVVDAADAVVEYANESYPSFVKHAFNCPPERTGEIKSNREIVADAVFVASKKRYAARVVDDEGERTNKLKIMGLEIKRSDTPTTVQNYLYHLIEMILNDVSKEKIQEEIKKMKEGYSEEDLKDIARPMGCNKLKFYQDQYDKTGSTKGFPYQVRAAMFYNSMCSPSDRKVRPGDKIGIVYIKDRRSKYIAFPADLNVLPSFIDDLVVDYDTQWKKAEKKIISYMKAIGYDFDSQKAAVRNDLFGF